MLPPFLEKYTPAVTSELPNYKPGTLVRFSSHSGLPYEDDENSIFAFFYLDEPMLTIFYKLEVIINSIEVFRPYLSEEDVDGLMERFTKLLSDKSLCHFTTEHFGAIYKNEPSGVTIAGHYIIPKSTLNLIEEKVEQPEEAIEVRSVSEASKADVDNRVRHLQGLIMAKKIIEEMFEDDKD